MVGAAGSALEQAGSELGQASNIIESTNQRYDEIAAENGVNQLRQRSMALEYGDPNDPSVGGFRNVQGSGAIGQDFFKDYTGRFDDASKEVSEGLANEQQRRFFQQRMGIVQGQYRGQLLSHIAQQTESFANSTSDATRKLELQTIAANPTNELGFKAGMARINGSIDSDAARLGEPPALAELKKAQLMDAAVSTQIKSINDTNPYAAEKLLEDKYALLGPQSRIILQDEVKKSVQQVQARDYAQHAIFGSPTPQVRPQDVAPAIDGVRPLEGIVKTMESGDQRYDKDGNLIASPAGAQGEMQVMSYTARDPGFGVTPAKDDSPGELARVGRDYLGAMVARYQDPALALAAYNAGPGKVDQWIAKYGDPRSGAISGADWASRIPFAETKDYVTRGLSMVAAGTGQPAAYSAPTAKELETQLPGIVSRARADAAQMYPGDPVFADNVASRVASYGRTVVEGWQAQQAAARDTITRGMLGTQPDGSDAPRTIDQLLANPAVRDAWNNATPEVQLAVQGKFKEGGDVPRTPETQALRYQLEGQFANDRDGFARLDLNQYIGKLPNADFNFVGGLQMRARDRLETDAERQATMQHNLSSVSWITRGAGITEPTATSPQKVKDTWNQFTGAFQHQVDEFQQTNQRPPNPKELDGIAGNLLTQVSQKGGGWFGGSKDVPVYAIDQSNAGSIRPKSIPQEFLSGIVPALTRANGGNAPTQAQIDTAYLLSLQHAQRRAPGP